MAAVNAVDYTQDLLRSIMLCEGVGKMSHGCSCEGVEPSTLCPCAASAIEGIRRQVDASLGSTAGTSTTPSHDLVLAALLVVEHIRPGIRGVNTTSFGDRGKLSPLLEAVLRSRVEVADIVDALLMSDLSQLRVLRESCTWFLKHNLDTSNCLHVLRVGQESGVADLQVAGSAEALRALEPAARADRDSFAALDKDTLTGLLTSDSLDIDSEITVWDLASKWLRSGDGRAGHVRELFGAVRLLLLSPRELEAVDSDHLVRSSTECTMEVARAVLSWHMGSRPLLRHRDIKRRKTEEEGARAAGAPGWALPGAQGEEARVVLGALQASASAGAEAGVAWEKKLQVGGPDDLLARCSGG